MKLLIAYSSRTGTTEKCVNILKEKLPEAILVNLRIDKANIDEYDYIIIGSPIRMGMFPKEVRNFIKKNKEILKTKKCAYFICCASNDDYEKFIQSNIPVDLLDKAVCYDTFGGEYNMENLKGFNKFVISMVKKIAGDKLGEVKIIDENISRFIKRIKEGK